MLWKLINPSDPYTFKAEIMVFLLCLLAFDIVTFILVCVFQRNVTLLKLVRYFFLAQLTVFMTLNVGWLIIRLGGGILEFQAYMSSDLADYEINLMLSNCFIVLGCHFTAQGLKTKIEKLKEQKGGNKNAT